MMNLYLIFYLIGFIVFPNSLKIHKKFEKIFTNKKEIILQTENDIYVSEIYILPDSTFLILDKKNKQIVRLNEKSNTLININVNRLIKHVDDAFIDSQNNVYVIDSFKHVIKVFNEQGKLLNSFNIMNGDLLCKLNKTSFLVYDTFHLPGEKKENVIHHYDFNGNYIKSFGNMPEKPTIDDAPFVKGSIFYNNDKIIVCHVSDYKIEIYNLDGKLEKTYNKKPSFYKKLTEFKSISQPYIDMMYRTTVQDKAFQVNENLIVSFFKRNDGTKKWLFIQDEKNSMEIDLPNYYYPFGVLNNKIYFLKERNDNPKSIIIYCYEIQKKIF